MFVRRNRVIYILFFIGKIIFFFPWTRKKETHLKIVLNKFPLWFYVSVWFVFSKSLIYLNKCLNIHPSFRYESLVFITSLILVWKNSLAANSEISLHIEIEIYLFETITKFAENQSIKSVLFFLFTSNRLTRFLKCKCGKIRNWTLDILLKPIEHVNL